MDQLVGESFDHLWDILLRIGMSSLTCSTNGARGANTDAAAEESEAVARMAESADIEGDHESSGTAWRAKRIISQARRPTPPWTAVSMIGF